MSKKTNYEETENIIFLNLEKEKKQINKKFKNISVPQYLYARLYATMVEAMFAAPCKHAAENLIKDALKDTKGFIKFCEKEERKQL